MQSCVVILLVIVSQTLSSPLQFSDSDPLPPLTVVTGLNSRVLSHSKKLQGQDPRFSLPTPQDIETIRKVAQILVTIGQQIIPPIIGEPQTSEASIVVDAPNDPVDQRIARGSVMINT